MDEGGGVSKLTHIERIHTVIQRTTIVSFTHEEKF